MNSASGSTKRRISQGVTTLSKWTKSRDTHFIQTSLSRLADVIRINPAIGVIAASLRSKFDSEGGAISRRPTCEAHDGIHIAQRVGKIELVGDVDRKSTRLNSSH